MGNWRKQIIRRQNENQNFVGNVNWYQKAQKISFFWKKTPSFNSGINMADDDDTLNF